jgi:hypothetical protein
MSKILVNRFTITRAVAELNREPERIFQDTLRGMENNGHTIISVSIQKLFDWSYEMFVVSEVKI